jgi:hypothetical protein
MRSILVGTIAPALLIVAAGAALGSWVPLAGPVGASSPDVTVIERTEDRTVIEVTVSGFWTEDVVVRGERFSRLSLGACGTTLEVGKPELPRIVRTVGVPHGAQVGVRVLEVDEVRLAGYRVYPAQEPPRDIDRGVGHGSFAVDEGFYGADMVYPEVTACVGSDAVWRDVSLVNVVIHPLRVNPGRGELHVARRMVVAVEHAGGERRERHLFVGESAPYRRILVNYDALGFDESRRGEPGTRYLVITHPDFEVGIQPLVDWHHRRGVETRVITRSDWTYQAIMDSVEAEYDRHDPPLLRWVLLVGDPIFVPTYSGYGFPSDSYYSFLKGSDFYAEVGIGRISASDPADLANQLDKIMSYATGPQMGGWLDTSVLVANREDYPGKYSQCKREIYHYNYTFFHPVMDTIMGGAGGTNADVTAAVNEGRNVVNYRGHGGTDNWSSWDWNGDSWTIGHVDALTNGEMTPVVFNIACYCGRITESECLSEAWMNKYPGGAAASLAASDPSYTYPNHDYDKALYWGFCDTMTVHGIGAPVCDLGWLMNYASAYIIPIWEDLAEENIKMYLWLGDPAMEIWPGVPGDLNVVHPDVIPLGPSDLQVTVNSSGSPVEGALVCAYQEGGVYEYDYTNTGGQVTLHVEPSEPDTVFISVTATGYLPYGGWALPISEGAYIAYIGHLVDDDREGTSYGNGDGSVNPGEQIELPVWVRNFGSADAYGVQGALTAPDDPYVTITDQLELFGDIPAGDTARSQDDFDFDVAMGCPDGHWIGFVMYAQDAAESTWVSQFMIQVVAPDLHYSDCDADDEPPLGNGNGVLEPGEGAYLTVTISNTGHGDARGVTADLSSAGDPYVTVTQDHASYGDIQAGSTGASSPPYEIAISSECPEPYYVQLYLDIQDEEGHAWSDVFEVIIMGAGFYDDMESGEGDWVHYVVTSGYLDEWHMEDYRSHSASHSWKCGSPGGGDYSNYVDAGLVTPFLLVPESAVLRFWHWMDAEIESGEWAWDGGIVEMSTDGGSSWYQIYPVGGYPYKIVDNPASPFEPETPCFSGSHSWKQEEFDLSGYSGGAHFRFRFGTDGYVTEEGWYIDDIWVGVPPPPVEVTVVPDNTVVPRGGKLGLTLAVENNTDESQGFNVWTEVILPNGKPYPGNPVVGPVYVTLAAGEVKSKHLYHKVPGKAPLGTYTYIGKIGTYPEPLMDSDAFQFEVVEP